MKRLLLLLALGAVFWALGGQVAAHGPAQRIDIREFVRQTFIHGVPYEEASRYGPEVVPVLLAMLEDPKEEVYWANIVATLGIIGDSQAFKPLISFLEKEVPGTLSYSHYVAKTGVIMSLGYLINKSGNQQALSYLQGGLNPAVWTERRLNWKSPFHATTAQRDRQLVSTAIIGLALSGHPAARESLLAFQKELGAQPEFRELVAEAIRANEEIAREGLAGYYRKDKVTGGSLSVLPTSVVPNQTITITGRGFTGGGAATINKAADGSSVSIGGFTADLKAVGGAASTKIAEGNTITIDSHGNWSGSVVVPINATTTTEGTHELKVRDSSGREGVVNLTILKRTLVLDPPSGRLGSTVRVRGVGYPAANTQTGADTIPTVSIKYPVGGADRVVATLTPDSSGNFSGGFTVPLDAAIPSTNTVKAEYKTPAGTTVTTSVTHQVPAAALSISPTSGRPGISATIKGVGYKAFTRVQEMTIGPIDVQSSPIPATDADGTFAVTVVVPQLNPGVHTVNVKVGGTTASASFLVTTNPAPHPAAAVAPPLAAALTPLGANLVRVWGFDAATQKFQLYDPAHLLLSDLTALKRGQGYWVNLRTAQPVTLGVGTYHLVAGWNLIGWLG